MSKRYDKVKVKVTGEVTVPYETEITLEDVDEKDIEDEIYNSLVGRSINEVDVTGILDFQDFEHEIEDEELAEEEDDSDEDLEDEIA